MADSPSQPPLPLPTSQLAPRRTRWLWLLLAYASLGIGIIGHLHSRPSHHRIRAAFRLGRRQGSPRLQRWLEQHRLFGPMIHNWRHGRVVARRAKISASLMMSLCLVIMLFTVKRHWVIVLATLGMAWVRPGCGRVRSGWKTPTPASAHEKACPAQADRLFERSPTGSGDRGRYLPQVDIAIGGVLVDAGQFLLREVQLLDRIQRIIELLTVRAPSVPRSRAHRAAPRRWPSAPGSGRAWRCRSRHGCAPGCLRTACAAAAKAHASRGPFRHAAQVLLVRRPCASGEADATPSSSSAGSRPLSIVRLSME
jgi:uncharacterized membrane protein YbaN (DUF454 family)